ncbi:hypothetical protein B5F83_01495 [Muribaculum sp. An289]|uniref:peptidylprolyl isomerase n=1 Tax=unclassified Muribaculum TaxID=2622126 RepID=UPI000B3A5765|nr:MULTISPECIES: peptidylprolyl isomerase [unclassified Muribaculum]OUO38561.1 hypothetical protein B5F83_01495 [Muribaculum sp. An289]OUO44052.1 hypothetical protein B5F81_02470 [Muribaculum sp. An287]
MNKGKFFLSLLILATLSSGAYAQKYDGIVDKTVAILGNESVLLSDIESGVMERVMNGYPVDRSTRCDVLENILENKLYVMQARVDSLDYDVNMVEEAVSQYADEMMARFGGQKDLEAYFNEPLYKLKDNWRATYQEMALAQQMRSSIYRNMPKLTPRDVEAFVESTPESELPVVPEQYQLSQIVLYPEREDAVLATRERLLELRERIMNGESFSMLARLYSQDVESARRGGELGMTPKSYYWPVFSDAAMSLKEGQVSQIVESPDGFHLIQMIEKDGDMFNARHILLKPEFTSEDRSKAFARLDSIKNEILSGNITFEMAAKANSEDLKSRTNGGQMADERTGSAYFNKDELKPADYNAIKGLNPGEISEPFQSLDNEGRGNVVYKIIKVDRIYPSHVANLSRDYDLLLGAATEEAGNKAVEDFIKEKMTATYIVIDPSYKECDFKYDWFKD